MNHYQDTTESIHAQRHEALLTLSIRILDGDRIRVTQCLLRMGEADLVLGKVGTCLGWSELDLHTLLCIRYAYSQAVAELAG